ncbi:MULTISPECIES: DUF1552 domain-containing protein [Crateriforma]|uniref:Secreted protein containing DUF1552 n=1 Tax=Crateriforma conspicua TaxID=2527996 RepID=A0A5C6FRM3_9PLAN|nr:MULTISPECIES: DUF1552 domain-containing protein [Crateriforma]TWU65737.1 hypothetical protein V7x_12860 [Crateriforma conspicua]
MTEPMQLRDRTTRGSKRFGRSRREFLRTLGISAAAAPFALSLPSLGWAGSNVAKPKKRIVFVFSPNGVIPKHFWPDNTGADYDVKRILEPLAGFQSRMTTLHGVNNQIRGDGDGHMRGIGCLLTGIELFPGDVQGGSDTPAGWSMGISVDQKIKNHLQANEQTRTRYGSLEFGVMVPDRADTWTRLSYAGPNQPVAPIDNPYQMFDRLYGKTHDRELLGSVLDGVVDDLRRLKKVVSSEDYQLLEDHLAMVRKVESDLKIERESIQRSSELETKDLGHAVPELTPNVEEENDNMPEITRMQIELLTSAFRSDFARVATFQITNSVGNPKMRWLDIDESHHSLSHEPDSNAEAYEKLIRINTWYAEQVAALAKRLDETPEPGADGSMLDHTTIVWTNELGKGNSHTRNNIPFVFVGDGLGFKTGQAMDFGGVPHNRLLMSFLQAFDCPQESFGNPDFCGDGVLNDLFV